MIRLSRFFYGTCWFLSGVLVIACKDEIIPEPFRPRNAYEAYSHALKQTGLHETALGKEWFLASEKALLQPVKVVSPYSEAFRVRRGPNIVAGKTAGGQNQTVQNC